MRTLLPRQWLLRLFLILACLGTAPPGARANVLDSFVQKYGEIENIVEPGVLPVSADYLKQSMDYIRCIADGTDVLVCTDRYHETGAGRDAATAAGIPTGFWVALDAYVAYKNGDYWEAAYLLGEAVACAAIQVFTGGVDLCGIIKELYELAEGLWEGVQEVLEFLADVGGVIVNAAEDVCQGIGLCDEDEGPPLHVLLLEQIYAPKVQDGVAARESRDNNAFPVLLHQLAEQAKSWVINSFNRIAPYQGQSIYDANRQKIDAEIKEAEKGYIQAVDTAWTGDITGRVMPELLGKQVNYLSTQITSLALGAAEAYAAGVHPSRWVSGQCLKDFIDYTMVDVWIDHFPVKAKELHLTSNRDWCKSLFDQHRSKFIDPFRQFVKSKVCPSSGAIVCNDVASLRLCLGLLGTVDKKQECGWSILEVGKQAAQMIQDDFKARGSKIPCNIVPPQIPKALLVQLRCTRPTQFAQCTKVYDEKFSDLPKVLDCSLMETEEYKALRAQVVAAVNTLNEEFGTGALEVDLYDPLIVLTRNVGVDEVKGYPRQDWGFGPPSNQRSFEYLYSVVSPYTIDGQSTPAVWNEAHVDEVLKEKARPTIEMRKPSPGELRSDLDNPVVHPLDAANRLRAPGLAGATVPQQQHQQQVMRGSLTPLPGLPGTFQAGTQGVQQLQPTTPAPTISTSLPTQAATAELPRVTAPRSGGFAPRSRGLATTRPLPDLTYTGMPRVGGVSVGWNGSVTVDALQATRSGGLCRFPLDYVVRNGGEQDSGQFRATVANTTVPDSGWQHDLRSLPPGASMTDSGTLVMRTGHNSLQFVLDDEAMVAESNETNNRATLAVIVSGSCDSSASLPQPMTAPRGLTRPGPIGR